MLKVEIPRGRAFSLCGIDSQSWAISGSGRVEGVQEAEFSICQTACHLKGFSVKILGQNLKRNRDPSAKEIMDLINEGLR